ncbi:MAG: hypothetical protein ACE5K7_02785 [Phycisphaerae bacterium]
MSGGAMMVAAVDWATVGLIVGTISPLMGVPMTMVALYLRSLRDQQVQRGSEMSRRFEAVEEDLRVMQRSLGDFERDYTTKEEWLRESMHARQQLERLTEMMGRIESQMDNANGLASQMGRAVTAMVELSRQLAGGGAESAGGL